MKYLVYFLGLHLDVKQRAACFALIVLLMPFDCVLWFFLTVPWVGLQCVIVVFPDHTHLQLSHDM